MRVRIRAFCLITVLAAVTPGGPRAAQAPGPADWPDTFVSRLEVFALMQTLSANILASRSSTLSLEQWCRDHKLADEPKIVARVLTGVDRPSAPEQRLRLQVSHATDVKYRRVRLACGTHVLAEADNWYVPGRLTAEMNRLLETTDTPFGTVVRPLEPYRQTLGAALLWSPLPDGWEMGKAGPAQMTGVLLIPDALFEHRALLYTREHTPFSEVREVYQRAILAFPPPRRQ
jgi:hypothetical protein